MYFLKIIFKDIENEKVVEVFALFYYLNIMLIFIFNNYYYLGKKFELYFFYNYMKVIFCIKYSIRQKENILFDSHHSNLLFKI